MPDYKIMIVEDEEIVAADIKMNLEKMGYSVCATASSGLEAIEKAELTRPDLVLMDIVLKGSMDGIEVARQIKELYEIPVVYLTAFGDDSILQRAKVAEPYGYITKPFRYRELQIAIEISIYKKQAEARIQKMERWLATVLRSIGDAVIASDNEHRITFLNVVAERLTGWNQEDALGKKLTEVLNIKDQDLSDLEKHLVEKVIMDGLIINLIEDRLLIAKDGTEVSISDSVAPIKEENGEPPGTVLVFRDITQQKQVEEDLHTHQVELEMQNEELRRTQVELETSHARYFDLYNLAPVGYLTLSKQGLILEANLAAATMLGVARGALVKQPLSRFILPEDQDAYYRHHKQLIETQPADSISSQQTCELRMVKQDMTPFWVRMEATTSKDIDGAPVCRVVMSDVTERKRAEEEIQRNDSRLKRLVDVLQYQSENVQDFLDYSLDQVIQLTGSKIGYIYHYHEDRKMFVLNTWSKEVMVECTVANPSNCYELDNTGIWGEAVRQRRPIIVNDFKATHPLKKGYPEGHVHLLKFVTVPIFKEGSIVGVVGLANKETDYEETDILQASLLMEAVWKVTERIYAEQKLQEQYQFLQAIMDAMPSPIFYKDTQGIYLGCNRAFAEFNGLTKEELIGKYVYELWKKELADIYYKADSQLLQNPGVQIYEASLRHADGTEHPVIFYKATFNNQDGTLGGLIGSFLDISDRKRAEEALRGSEERFRLLIETTGDMIYSVNTKGFLTYVNPTMERTLGYPHNELEGKSFAWIVAPECNDLVTSNFKRAMKGESVPVYEVLLTRKDGTTLSVEFNVATIYDLEGNPVGRYGIGRDVTDRIRSEETLRDSEARFRQVFDNMADGMAIYEAIDDGGDFVFVDINRKGQILSSISHNDVIGKRVTETFPAVEKIGLLDIFRHVWRTGEAQDHPISLYEDGRIQQWVENHVFKLPSGLIAALYSDKSEKYRVEEEHRSMEKQLFKAQKMEAIGTLAGGIAHDFNNILGAIIGYTELALDEDRKERRIHDLQEVLKGAERAGKLVKQILSFSRQDNQEKKPLDIKILLKEAIKFLRASIPSTIELNQHITADTCNILADPTQIYQVIMNLVTNAVHAMKKTGGVLKIELSVIAIAPGEIIHHTDLRPGPYVKLSVGDTGYGIDHAHINRIFDPFFTTKDKGEGTGLGLSVVYGIVKSHDGVVNVYSEQGKGATFNVYLPGITHSGTMSVDMFKPLVGGTERILFVDDEHTLVDMGREMLSSLGYDVTGVTNSTEALVLLSSEPARFDLVITDMTMPKMTGIDLSREIMKIRPDIPIILCSGLSEPDTEDQAQMLGIRAYCLKPLTKRDLSEVIRESLDGHEKPIL